MLKPKCVLLKKLVRDHSSLYIRFDEATTLQSCGVKPKFRLFIKVYYNNVTITVSILHWRAVKLEELASGHFD